MTEVLDPQQEAMMKAAQPTAEHEWLHQLVGEWAYEFTVQEPGKPPVKLTGTQRIRSIAGLWIVGEGEGEGESLLGGCDTMILTLGYDPRKGRFVGSWIGSMGPMLWVYDGYLDEARRALTLESDGPSFTKEGEMGKYRDTVTIENANYYTLTATFLGDDGAWNEMMTMHFRRK